MGGYSGDSDCAVRGVDKGEMSLKTRCKYCASSLVMGKLIKRPDDYAKEYRCDVCKREWTEELDNDERRSAD